MKRTRPPARKAALKRSELTRRRATNLKPKRRGDEPGRAEAVAAWRTAVLGDVNSYMDPHHALPRRWLLQYAKRQGLRGPAFWAVVYDPRIGVALDRDTHAAHTMRSAVIPYEALPARVAEAAAEYGPEAVAALEREHPKRQA